MIETKTNIQDIKLVDFPEEIDEQNGIKLYGEITEEYVAKLAKDPISYNLVH